MQTKQVYYEDPYKKELECKVLEVKPQGVLLNVIVDQTIFYPEGGGQPSDKGMLGEAKVEYVRMIDGEIVHQVKGNLNVGTVVKQVLDWDWRYKYMRIHTAGHLLHDVLMTLVPELVPIKGGHGKKPYIEYEGKIDPVMKDQIEQKVNEVLQKKLPVVTKFASYEELEKESKFLANLPRSKQLRMIKIGDFAGMADGGVQVANTKEIGKIWIANIVSKNGKSLIRYGIAG